MCVYSLKYVLCKYKFSLQFSGASLKALPDRRITDNILELSAKDALWFTYFSTCDKYKNCYAL